MSHWERAVRSAAARFRYLTSSMDSTSDARAALTAADEHLHDHYLERIIKGQDDQADEALLEHYRLIALREELERLTAGGLSLKELLYTLPYLRARVAELEGQKQ